MAEVAAIGLVGLAASVITIAVFGVQVTSVVYQIHESYTSGEKWEGTFSIKLTVDLLEKHATTLADFRKKSRTQRAGKRLGEIADECLKIARSLIDFLKKINMKSLLSGQDKTLWSKIQAFVRKVQVQRLQKQLQKYRKLVQTEINRVKSTLKDTVRTTLGGDKRQDKILDMTITLSDLDLKSILSKSHVQNMIKEQEKALGIHRLKGA